MTSVFIIKSNKRVTKMHLRQLIQKD